MKTILRALLVGGTMLAATPVVSWAAPPAAIDGVAIPDTPPGHAMAEWLAAFDGGDTAAMTAFETRYQLPVRDPAQRLQFLKMTGGFILVRVERSEPAHIVALLKEKASDNYSHLDLSMDGAMPPKITNISVNLTPPPADLAPARLSDAALPAALNARVDAAVARDQFSGVVLVAHDGRIVAEKAAGLADRATHAPVTPDTQFRIGSMNKMFTAVAILQLVEAGKVGLDDPLGKYLPDYPNKDTAKVTVRQLLTHTGGTGDIFTDEYLAKRLQTRTVGDYIALFGQRPPAFKPGDHFEYSNYGFVLLGAIVERASGRDYYAYVEQHVFKPAGMTHTASLPEDAVVPGRATGYMHGDNDQWTPNTDTLPWRGSPAGGGYSTAGDLLKFAEALKAGKLLKPGTLAMATAAQSKMGPNNGYGFGFHAADDSAFGFYGHNGGAPGMNGDLRVYPKTGYVIVALSNLDPPAASGMADFAELRVGGP